MSTAGLTIRRAAAGDLAAVEALLEASALPLAGVAEGLGAFLVVEAAERVVGVAGLEAHGAEGVLRSVAVDPAFRGRGVGAELTARVVARAREAGLRRLYLLTTTAESYFAARGFRRTSRAAASPEVRSSVEFRGACPETAVAMVLELEGDRCGMP